MRLRQVVLVAADLEGSLRAAQDLLGAGEPFRDPGVQVFGLRNAVLPIGDTFLEIVSPARDDAPAARYRERAGGDGGYMLMLQTDDLARERERLAGLGVRVAWEIALDDIAGMHLHPKDTGGTLLSLDEPRPAAAWRWAGPDWPARSRRDVARAIVAAELASPDPSALARRFGEILGRTVEREGANLAIGLEGGRLRFGAGPRERLVGFEVEAADRARAGREDRLAGARVRWV